MKPDMQSATAFGPRFASLARAFMDRGAKPDTCISIALPNGIAFIEAMIAAWKIGATPQPVAARLPKVELDAIVELAAPSLRADDGKVRRAALRSARLGKFGR